MKMIFAGPLLVALAIPAVAETRTVTLYVPGMDCAACPITIKKALGKVDGVAKAEVSFERRAAVVTYDDTRTGLEALMRATRDAGYPSTPVGERK